MNRWLPTLIIVAVLAVLDTVVILIGVVTAR